MSTECINCGCAIGEKYDLILDGKQHTSIRLCDSCYDSCYDEVLGAEWIEEAS